MNRINAPAINDASVFVLLSKNSNLGSYPDLLSLRRRFKSYYGKYKDIFDSPAKIRRLKGLSQRESEHLKNLYKSPPKDLKFIDDMRRATDHRPCPMCGSMHSGTLDHYLPKEQFPAFAILSMNLVPACKCNSKRGQTVWGGSAGERILHPYLDSCLANRLVSAHFEDLGTAPKVSLKLTASPNHPQYNAIRFHVREILEKSSVLGYMSDRWNKLVRMPEQVVRDLRKDVTTEQDLIAILEAELALLDNFHESRNNWNSMFVSGLLDRDVVAWLLQKLSAPGRQPGGSLI